MNLRIFEDEVLERTDRRAQVALLVDTVRSEAFSDNEMLSVLMLLMGVPPYEIARVLPRTHGGGDGLTLSRFYQILYQAFDKLGAQGFHAVQLSEVVPRRRKTKGAGG